MDAVDWSVVREWGLQVPVVGMMFATVALFCATVLSIIWLGMKHVRTSTQELAVVSKENTEKICSTTERCLDSMVRVGEETVKVIDRNTEAFISNRICLEQVSSQMREINHRLNMEEHPHHDAAAARRGD